MPASLSREHKLADQDNLLHDAMIQSAMARDKPYTLRDGKGLFLLVHPNGSKYFQLRATVAGVRKLIQIGVYPKISIEQARQLAKNKILSLEQTGALANASADSEPVQSRQARPGLDFSATTMTDSNPDSAATKQADASDNTMVKPSVKSPSKRKVSDVTPASAAPSTQQDQIPPLDEIAMPPTVEAKQHEQEADATRIDMLWDEQALLSEPFEANRLDPKKVPPVVLTYEQIVYQPNQLSKIPGFFGKLVRKIKSALQNIVAALQGWISQVADLVIRGGNNIRSSLHRTAHTLQQRIAQSLQQLRVQTGPALLRLLRTIITAMRTLQPDMNPRVLHPKQHLLATTKAMRQAILGLLRRIVAGIAWLEKCIIDGLCHPIRQAWAWIPARIRQRQQEMLSANQLLAPTRMNHALEYRGNYVVAVVAILLRQWMQ